MKRHQIQGGLGANSSMQWTALCAAADAGT